MNDQFGDKVPDDLILMPPIDLLSSSKHKTIINANWYDVYTDGEFGFSSLLCISVKAIDYVFGAAIEDCIDEPVKEVLLVDDILKRWSIEDGFYHV